MKIKYNIQDLISNLKDLYTLTGIRTVIFDDEFHEILAYPTQHSEYCSLVREFSPLLEKCQICDKVACKKVKETKTSYTYKCHAGMYESVVPIKYNNKVIGYFIFGQMTIDEEKNKILSDLHSYLITHQFSEEKVARITKIYNQQPSIPYEKLTALLNIITINANYLMLSKKYQLSKNKLAKDIENYIIHNIEKDISVTSLCDVFNISKNRLYKISNENYGLAIAEYIRLLKIQEAKILLTESDELIYNIATKVGIPDYNYFTKVFKSIVGMTPKDYRKYN